MRQTSRYFSVMTEAFIAEGGTIDKFIGDAVMVFWNAPNPQADHVARACRAALAARAAGERLNAEFEAESLTPFITRFGIHVGEAVQAHSSIPMTCGGGDGGAGSCPRRSAVLRLPGRPWRANSRAPAAPPRANPVAACSRAKRGVVRA